MIKQFFTPLGVIQKDLTLEEIKAMADFGDADSKLFLSKKDYAAAKDVQQSLSVIANLLELIEPIQKTP